MVSACIVKEVYYGRPDVVKVQQYIDEHWRDAYDADAVAAAGSKGVRQLHNIFKQHLGKTPYEYYRQVKVQHIKDKLRDTSLTITEVFAACGDDSRNAYSKMFRKVTGTTPTEFRKRHSF